MNVRLVAAVLAACAGCGSEVTRGAGDGAATLDASGDGEGGALDAADDGDDARAPDAAGDAAACLSVAQTSCGGACVYLSINDRHCGACGHACPEGALCRQGQCLCSGTLCGGACVSLASDAANCGACGRACADGHVCVEGACGCAFAECGGRCVDPQTDDANCGACGHACAATERCGAGSCACTLEGRGSCGGAACGTDLRADAANCGGCGASCAAGQRCDGGHCATTCPRGATDCDRDAAGVCEAFLDASDAHCGACGRACAVGERCVAGRCATTAVTPRMPGSGVAATSGRPWFRWALAGGADGARVQVCADRACARTEWQADATGTSARPPAALAPGAHFWRLFARRGDTVDAAAGPTWEFLVPGEGVAWDLRSNGLMDLDGDGREDRVTTDASAPGVLRVVYGGGSRADSVHRLPRPGDLPFLATGYSAPATIAAGDLDGDGFADLVTWHTTVTQYSTTGFAPGMMHLVFYGSAAGLTDRTAVFGTGPWFAVHGTYALLGSAALGTYRDRPGGDVAIATRMGTFPNACAADFTATVRDDREGWGDVCDDVAFAAGDYDADGRVDVVVWPAGRVFTSGGAARAIGPCAAVPAGARGEAVRAADVDGDGYDDLVRTAAGARAVIYGGPGGLDGSRCAALP